MNIEEIRAYALSFPKATEGFPFGGSYLVFKVLGKMFLITDLEKVPLSISLKCNPDWALELRENYEEITAGFHLNKKHWNTIQAEYLPKELVQKMIQHSYEEVVKKLSKKLQNELINERK